MQLLMIGMHDAPYGKHLTLECPSSIAVAYGHWVPSDSVTANPTSMISTGHSVSATETRQSRALHSVQLATGSSVHRAPVDCGSPCH